MQLVSYILPWHGVFVIYKRTALHRMVKKMKSAQLVRKSMTMNMVLETRVRVNMITHLKYTGKTNY